MQAAAQDRRPIVKIAFARHGESYANLQHEVSNRGLGRGLTRRGRQQAGALARRLADWPVARIYSSPLLRAIETSVILADRLGVDYEVVEALREYDCSILEGRSDPAAWQMWQELFDAWRYHQQWTRRLKGGESLAQVRDRFVPLIDRLVQEYRDTDANLVCVGHGGLYWVLLPLVLQNVDPGLVSRRHGFAHDTLVVAEWTPAGLLGREWNGAAIDAPELTGDHQVYEGQHRLER